MNWKNEWEMVEEYFWIMGMALMGMGIGFIFQNGKTLLITGLAVTMIGVVLNIRRPKA